MNDPFEEFARTAASAPTCATPAAGNPRALEIDRPWDAYTDDTSG
jgi:hypothetical protein